MTHSFATLRSSDLIATKYQSVPSAVLYSGGSLLSWNRFGSMPSLILFAKASNIFCASSNLPVLNVSPGKEIIVSRLQSVKDRKSTRLELQSLMRISYAGFCLKKKKTTRQQQ